MSSDALTKWDLHPASQGAALRRKLTAVRGLRLEGSHRGRYSLGTTAATVVLDAHNALRLEASAGRPIAPPQALAANLALPGNLRFAIGVSNLKLLADVRIGDGEDLAAALRYVRAGLRAVLADAKRRRQPQDEPLGKDEVQAALRRTPWDDQAIVEMDDAWELRPRFDDEPVPVKLTMEGPEVHLRRVVVGNYREPCRTEVVAAQALRFNALSKHARLAASGEQIVADARIHRTLLNGVALVTAARAVASVERRVHHVLQILTTQEEIAERYSAMFDVG